MTIRQFFLWFFFEELISMSGYSLCKSQHDTLAMAFSL